MQIKKSILTQAIVKELLDYDPVKGTMVWRKRAQHWFASYRSMCSWNAKFAGKPALATMTKDSKTKQELYPGGTILWEAHVAHRIAFLYMTGRWPGEIDHRNRNKRDYRWRNLKEVDRTGNLKNRDRLVCNTSGRTGVRRNGKKFEARISCNGKQIALGYHETFEAACRAREVAEQRYGFTPDARR